ncbi:hypothetical protein GALL_427060 [mine drainage metagenome]|uniref:Uncharacterized protein n=1 Tax=mine drainage metagenome TaxID=410659 RepID=A0A1J5Q6J3_9ZZZZ
MRSSDQPAALNGRCQCLNFSSRISEGWSRRRRKPAFPEDAVLCIPRRLPVGAFALDQAPEVRSGFQCGRLSTCQIVVSAHDALTHQQDAIAVEHDVVEAEHAVMALRTHPVQGKTPERELFRVNSGIFQLRDGAPRFLFGIVAAVRLCGPIGVRQCPAQIRGNAPRGLSQTLTDHRAQHRFGRDHIPDGLLEQIDPQGLLDPHDEADVVNRTPQQLLPQEDFLLRQAQRNRFQIGAKICVGVGLVCLCDVWEECHVFFVEVARGQASTEEAHGSRVGTVNSNSSTDKGRDCRGSEALTTIPARAPRAVHVRGTGGGSRLILWHRGALRRSGVGEFCAIP